MLSERYRLLWARAGKRIGVLLMGALIQCVAVEVAAERGDRDDPLETYNRAMFAFNDAADRWFMKPLARGYRGVTPDFVENGIARMFGNLGEVRNTVNDVLQGKFAQAGNDGGRFLVNSTIGLLGFFDIAREMGLPKSEGEDFGQTFAVWGMAEGAYVVLPLFGPSTVRDAPGRLMDGFLNPIAYEDHVPTRNSLYGGQALSARAELLEAEKLVSGDRYSFVKDIYLQRREFLINDGEVEDDFGGEDYN